MKAKDTLRMGVLRYYLAAVKNREVELRPQGLTITDEDLTKIYKKQIKQRKQNMESFEMGKRPDLVEKERSELEVLRTLASYFPDYVEQ